MNEIEEILDDVIYFVERGNITNALIVISAAKIYLDNAENSKKPQHFLGREYLCTR